MNQNNIDHKWDDNTKDIISLISNLQERHRKFDRLISYSGNLVSSREAKRRLALRLYSDILLILDRIGNGLSRLNELEKLKVQYLDSRKKHGVISPRSKLYKVIINSDNYRNYLVLDITTLFHWIYIIDDLFNKNSGFSKHIIAFRNKFSVHFSGRIKNKKTDRQLMYSNMFGKDGILLIYLPFFNKNGFRGFNKTEKEVEKYIPAIKKESNLNEKVKIIWNNIDKLPKSMRNPGSRNKNSFINCLSRYGVVSPSIEAVIKNLIKVWDKKVIPLCNYEKIKK